MLEQKKEPQLINLGIYTALLEALYCLIIGILLFKIQTFIPRLDGVVSIGMFLVLLVVSVSISGVLIFGLPVLLAIQSRLKEGLKVLAATLLTLLGMFFIFILLVSFLTR